MQTERQTQIIEKSIELIATKGIQGFTIKNFQKHWHDDKHIEKNHPQESFDYSTIDSLRYFEGTPQVMQERIKRQNWEFNSIPPKEVSV